MQLIHPNKVLCSHVNTPCEIKWSFPLYCIGASLDVTTPTLVVHWCLTRCHYSDLGVALGPHQMSLLRPWCCTGASLGVTTPTLVLHWCLIRCHDSLGVALVVHQVSLLLGGALVPHQMSLLRPWCCISALLAVTTVKQFLNRCHHSFCFALVTHQVSLGVALLGNVYQPSNIHQSKCMNKHIFVQHYVQNSLRADQKYMLPAPTMVVDDVNWCVRSSIVWCVGQHKAIMSGCLSAMAMLSSLLIR